MNETLKAANDIRKLAQTFQAISNLAPLLDRLGTLEQAEAEAGERIRRANAEAQSAIAGIADARAEAASVIEDANNAAELIVSNANHSAASIIEEANRLRAEEDAYSKKSANEANKRVKDAKEKAEAHESVASKLRNEIATLENRIEKAREQISAMLQT